MSRQHWPYLVTSPFNTALVTCVMLLQTLYPARVLSTCYNLLYLVVLCVLFFGGPRLWPNKRQRMLTGYGMFVFAIAAPPLVSRAGGGGLLLTERVHWYMHAHYHHYARWANSNDVTSCVCVWGGGGSNKVLWRAPAVAQQALEDADWVWHVCLCYCSTLAGECVVSVCGLGSGRMGEGRKNMLHCSCANLQANLPW
jgi:hypothetical protein